MTERTARPNPLLPELVVFDVDGTLQDTLQWWPEVAARGVLELGRRHGLSLPEPDRAVACGVVGHVDEAVWCPLLPAEHGSLWKELRETVIPLEREVLSSGRDFLFPGTREMLAELRVRGVRIALASNCRSRYFSAVLEGQRLGELVDAAYCLDTPGVTCKADMVSRALREGGTRRAVVVGDRRIDQQAAAAHGLPFVWREGVHASEVRSPSAVFRESAELLPLLERRGGRLRLLASTIDQASTRGETPLRVGVTGAVGAGKSELARELATLLPGSRVVSMDSFLWASARETARPRDGSRAKDTGDASTPMPGSATDHLRAAFDLDALLSEVLPTEGQSTQGDLLILEGIFLLTPEIHLRLDRIVFLEVAEEELLIRAAGRGRDPVEVHRDRYLPVHRDLVARYPPDEFADWIFENTNLLDPGLRGEGARRSRYRGQ